MNGHAELYALTHDPAQAAHQALALFEDRNVAAETISRFAYAAWLKGRDDLVAFWEDVHGRITRRADT